MFYWKELRLFRFAILSISYHCVQRYNFLGPSVLPYHDVRSHSHLDGTETYDYHITWLKEEN